MRRVRTHFHPKHAHLHKTKSSIYFCLWVMSLSVQLRHACTQSFTGLRWGEDRGVCWRSVLVTLSISLLPYVEAQPLLSASHSVIQSVSELTETGRQAGGPQDPDGPVLYSPSSSSVSLIQRHGLGLRTSFLSICLSVCQSQARQADECCFMCSRIRMWRLNHLSWNWDLSMEQGSSWAGKTVTLSLSSVTFIIVPFKSGFRHLTPLLVPYGTPLKDSLSPLPKMHREHGTYSRRTKNKKLWSRFQFLKK
jgi:hypothetical protein